MSLQKIGSISDCKQNERKTTTNGVFEVVLVDIKTSKVTHKSRDRIIKVGRATGPSALEYPCKFVGIALTMDSIHLLFMSPPALSQSEDENLF
ncbi:unnamed protein product [Acanthocheilonema viteae]|uniref:Uncharacterized protein n=1 Tax=Acanthocheilonema viteae TaxID=6277 RepID=A0A498SB37_ACAVI|nr:unnamed protein product [Acanthocheilonema viteae]